MSLKEFLFNFKLLIKHLQEQVNTTFTIFYNKPLLFYTTPGLQKCIFFQNKTEYNEKSCWKKNCCLWTYFYGFLITVMQITKSTLNELLITNSFTNKPKTLPLSSIQSFSVSELISQRYDSNDLHFSWQKKERQGATLLTWVKDWLSLWSASGSILNHRHTIQFIQTPES